MLAIAGPSCPYSYAIEARVAQGVVEDIKNQDITPHTYPWRERLPVSVNPLQTDGSGICIRHKAEYELDDDRRDEITQDIQQILPDSSQKRDWLILASIGLKDVDLVETVLEAATDRSKIVLILSSDLIQNSGSEVKKMISRVDFLIQNEEEIKQLCSKLLGIDVDENQDSWLDTLKRLGCKNIIVTRGVEGVVAMKDGSERLICQRAFQVAVKDSVGAGDAFTGGFVFAQSCGKSFEESLRWGSATAAVQVGVLGGKPRICLNQVEGILLREN
jgi:sugar/nucleoside kinase (ribokinase family)